jgi:hypothetical protein
LGLKEAEGCLDPQPAWNARNIVIPMMMASPPIEGNLNPEILLRPQLQIVFRTGCPPLQSEKLYRSLNQNVRIVYT